MVRVAVPRAVAMVVEEAGRASPCVRMARNDISPTLPRRQRRRVRGVKDFVHFSICACHPCAGAMLIFSVSFQFYRMIPEGNPSRRLAVAYVCVVRAYAARSRASTAPHGQLAFRKSATWCSFSTKGRLPAERHAPRFGPRSARCGPRVALNTNRKTNAHED